MTFGKTLFRYTYPRNSVYQMQMTFYLWDVGGGDGSVHLPTSECLDPSNLTWSLRVFRHGLRASGGATHERLGG